MKEKFRVVCLQPVNFNGQCLEPGRETEMSEEEFAKYPGKVDRLPGQEKVPVKQEAKEKSK